MKVYKGIVKDNTILLEETPDLPDECGVLVESKPVDEAGHRRSRGGTSRYSRRRRAWVSCSIRSERIFMTDDMRLIDTNVLVHAYTVSDECK